MKTQNAIGFAFRLSAISAVSALALGHAIAQDNDEAKQEDGTRKLETVTVTSQRREENLQIVPVAVTAIGAEEVAAARITNVTDLSSLAPNVRVEAAAGGNRIPLITIRGITAGNGSIGVDNQIGFYIDGVYIGNFFGAMQDVGDIERIEVLRGPQGTLFGRNSTGGAISITTQKPTGEFGAELSASAGNFDYRRFKGSVNLPEFAGIALKANFLHFEEEGDVRNLGGGTVYDWTNFSRGLVGSLRASDKLGGEDFDGFRLAANISSIDKVEIDYAYDWSEGTYTNEAFQVLGFSDGSAFIQGIFANSAANGSPIAISRTRLEAVNNELSTPSIQENESHTFRASYEATSNLSFKNITNWRSVETSPSSNQLDGAGGLLYNSAVLGNPTPEPAVPAFLLGISPAARDMEQFSTEFQIDYTSDRFDFIGGYYHFKLDDEQIPPANVAFLRLAPGNVVGGTAFDPTNTQVPLNSSVETVSNALYGQGTLHVTDRLDLTAGARYTEDKKTIVDPNLALANNTLEYEDDNTDWLINLGYDFTDTIYGYAKVSTGYLSGGAANGVAFAPEEITAYEAGLKSSLLDQRLIFNTAVFFQDYKNLQFIDPSSGGLNTINAGRTEIQGIEIETAFLATDRLKLSGNLGYTDTKLKELDPVVGDPDTYRLSGRPEWTSSLSAQYDVAETSFGRFVLEADAQYHSNVLLSPGLPIMDEPGLYDAIQTGDVWLLNARARLVDIPLGGTTGELSIWGQNLTDDDTVTTGNNLGTVFAGTFRKPATYGVDLTVRF